jgi:hypothetical protein
MIILYKKRKLNKSKMKSPIKTSMLKKYIRPKYIGGFIGVCLAVYGGYCLLVKGDCPASTVYTPTKVESRVVEKTTFTTNHHKKANGNNSVLVANSTS